MVVELHVADGLVRRRQRLDVLHRGRRERRSGERDVARHGRAEVEHTEGVGAGGGREQAGVERGDAGRRVVVDQIDAIDRHHLRAARDARGGGRRARVGVGDHGLARRLGGDQRSLEAVAIRHAALRQRNPGRGVVDEVEVILLLARSRQQRRLEHVEVILRCRVDQRVQRGGAQRPHVLVPEVGFVGPRTNPALLIGGVAALRDRAGRDQPVVAEDGCTAVTATAATRQHQRCGDRHAGTRHLTCFTHRQLHFASPEVAGARQTQS